MYLAYIVAHKIDPNRSSNFLSWPDNSGAHIHTHIYMCRSPLFKLIASSPPPPNTHRYPWIHTQIHVYYGISFLLDLDVNESWSKRVSTIWFRNFCHKITSTWNPASDGRIARQAGGGCESKRIQLGHLYDTTDNRKACDNNTNNWTEWWPEWPEADT